MTTITVSTERARVPGGAGRERERPRRGALRALRRAARTCGVLLAATLAGCVSAAEPQAPPDPNQHPLFPRETIAEMRAYLDAERTILADEVVVFLTHDPFFTWSTFNGSFANERMDPDKGVGVRHVVMPDQAITRSETGGQREGQLTVTIERVSEAVPTEATLPRATIGDGLVLMAMRKIVLHYDLRPSRDRPAQLHVQGSGSAVLFAAHEEPQKQRGVAVTFTLDVVPTGGEGPARFRVEQGEEVLQ